MRPRSDTGFRIRSNIRSINNPERCLYSVSAREWLSACDTTHNVRPRREFLRAQSIRPGNSPRKGAPREQSPAAATKAGHRRSQREPLRLLRHQCVESLHPRFPTQMPRHTASLTHVAHRREGIETKTRAGIGVRYCSRTDSAGRRESTLQLRVSGETLSRRADT